MPRYPIRGRRPGRAGLTRYVFIAGGATSPTTDSATIYVDLQASGTDEYTTTGTQYTDSATVYVDIQTSATEVREIPDSATVLIDLQASGTDTAQFVETPVFPANGILDNFNRADEDPLSQAGEWTGLSGLSGLKVVSNTLQSGVNYAGAYRTNFLGRDVEVYATLGTFVTDYDWALGVRYHDGGAVSPIRNANSRGYQFFFDGHQGWVIYRVDDGAGVALQPSNGIPVNWDGGALSAGDKVGGRIIGDRLEVWYKRGTDPWKLAGFTTDSTYTGLGTLFVNGQIGAILDDFAGGDAVTAIYVDLQASGTDEYTAGGVQYTDSATVLVDLQSSGTEIHEIPDADTVLFDLQTSSVELLEGVDSGSINLALNANAVELREQFDSVSVFFDLSVASVELVEYVDSATIYADIQSSGIEVTEYVDATTVQLLLAPTSAEIIEAVEAATVNLDLQSSGTEFIEHLTTDADTVLVDISATSTEIQEAADAQTIYALLSISAVELHEIPDADTAYVDLQSSGTDEYAAGGTQYTDSATAYADIDASSVELAEFVDSSTVPLLLAASGTDIIELVDLATIYLLLTVASGEFAEVTEAFAVYLDIQASGTEVFTPAPQVAVPNADVTTNGWAPTPLWQQISDSSNATYIYAVAS